MSQSSRQRAQAHGVGSVTTVRRCGSAPRFRFQCPTEWSSLQPVGDDGDVRFCRSCEERVYFCRTDEETIERAVAGQCVAREGPDMSGHSRVLGRVEVAEADPARDAALDWLQAEREVARAIQDPVDLNGTFCARCHYPVAKWLHRCSVCREPVGR